MVLIVTKFQNKQKKVILGDNIISLMEMLLEGGGSKIKGKHISQCIIKHMKSCCELLKIVAYLYSYFGDFGLNSS